LNRQKAKYYPDSTSVTYTYDNDSHLTQVSDPTGTYQFTYDNMGRLKQTTTSYVFLTGKTFTDAYAYDAASNRTSLTDPENGATSYSYDSLNRLTTLAPPSAFGSGSFGLSYDALSRRAQLTRPNSVSTSYTYDLLSRLLSATHATRRTTLDGASYTVDAVGNRTSRTPLPSGTATNYSYDGIYELLIATQGSTTKESYSYDVVGNRLSSLGVSPYSYNTSNELTAKPGVAYTYDNNGNALTKVDSTGTTTYAWDFENRLSSVTLPGSGGTITFKYDPLGRRIYKSSSSGTSIFAYDADNLIEEVSATAVVVARYTQGLGIDEPLAELRSGTTSYYEADGLGSITSLSNSSGVIANTYTYDSFGNLTASAGTIVNPFRYTAHEFDSETGLYYYRARYYDSMTGRFLSEDPFKTDSNQYVYVSNGPTNILDQSGAQGTPAIFGPNPFPNMSGSELSEFNGGLELAKKTCDANKACDGALQDYGIKSLGALVSQMAANINVFDGRKSTYPVGKQTVSKFLGQGAAGAMVPFPVQLTFLGDYFFNPTVINSLTQQRALILLHESVHEFGGKTDADFGGSAKLTQAIAEKCFPALKALRLLGRLTF
jgi:RHS repeat-associated protein